MVKKNVPDSSGLVTAGLTGFAPASSFARPAVDVFDTWLNRSVSGSNATLTDYASGPIILRGSLITGSDQKTMVLKDAPSSPPWTIDAVFSGWTENASEPKMLFGLQSVTGAKLVIQRIEAPNVYVDSFANSNLSTGGDFTLDTLTQKIPSSMLTRVRIKHTGDGLEFYYTVDGFYWIKHLVVNAANALNYLTGGIAKVGWGVDRGATAAHRAAIVCLWGWVEY